MKLFYKILLVITFANYKLICVNAQNLVPNGNFEDTVACPDSGIGMQIEKAKYWFNTNVTTPDFFHKCVSYYPVLFNNSFGNIFEPVNNNGIVGIFNFQNSSIDASEYIETKLTQKLLLNYKYGVEIYLKASKPFSACDAVDLYFTNDTLKNDSIFFYSRHPQVSNPIGNIISDSLNWFILRDTFTANGGEEFLTIGSFRLGSQTNAILGASGDLRAYVFIDNVSVVLLDTTGIIETENQFYFSIYPNPVSDYIFIESKIQNANFILTDVTGRLLMQFNATGSRTQISVAHLPNGVYFVTNNRFCRKIIINK